MSCSSNKLALSEINFTPENISKGELLLLKVEDSEKIISKIIGFLRMDNSYKFELNDSGKDGDKVPGDSIWSLEYRVPRNARARTYKLDFYAYDVQGNKIMTIEDDGSENPLSASVRVIR